MRDVVATLGFPGCGEVSWLCISMVCGGMKTGVAQPVEADAGAGVTGDDEKAVSGTLEKSGDDTLATSVSTLVATLENGPKP